MDYDLIVIGGGPAGYVGAIRAAQHGRKVLCVEKERAGGTCLNWGCIPTKSLLRAAELYQLLNGDIDKFGIKVGKLDYDWKTIISRSRGVADKLAAGIEFLFKKNKVDYKIGEASVVEINTVVVKDSKGKEETLTARRILVATGVVPRELPGLPFDGKTVIGSREAMVLAKQPKSIVIIGAGAIGVEFAYFFNSFGTKVTLVEMMPNILPVEDTEVSQTLEKALKKQGVDILPGTKVETAEVSDSGVAIEVAGKKKQTIEAEIALVAIGVRPLMPGGLNYRLDPKGYIATSDDYQTGVRDIYAAGDIIGPPWLAHVASWEAIQAVDGMFTDHRPSRISNFPGCTYCHPQVASLGLTESAARERKIKYKVGKFPFMASGKAQAVGEEEGFVKLLFSEPHGALIGAHIIGPDATELIAELGLGMTLEATCEEIEATIHAHPTLSEAIHEATGLAHGKAIHF